MNKKVFKNVVLLIIIVIAATGLWYFFKPYDYSVSFESKTRPGTINQTLKLWDKSLKHSKITESISTEQVKQVFPYEDHEYIYNWEFKDKNDSITQVNIGIVDSKSNFSNRFASLFNDTQIKIQAKKNISDFISVLNEHLDSHDVKIIGEAMSPEVFCAYLSFETEQMLKANEMMKTYTFLSTELLKDKVKMKGNPMVEITKWDTKTDSIHFNFCFPIVQQDSLPKHPSIKFKKIKSQKSLKAEYHGNYISSDRAWYELLYYAEKNDININNKPIEVFHNNPNFGSNERDWKTEVFMPIKE